MRSHLLSGHFSYKMTEGFKCSQVRISYTCTNLAASPYCFQSPLVLVPVAFKKCDSRPFLLKTHELLKQGHMNVVLCMLKWLQNISIFRPQDELRLILSEFLTTEDLGHSVKLPIFTY